MIKNEGTTQVSKIAVLNPYLQGGHTQIAEIESTARFIQTAKQHSIDVKVFGSSEEMEEYAPDFVIALTYQEGKLSKYPTYLSVNIPISLIRDVPRFIRNILTYDGFLTASPHIMDWLKQLCSLHNKKPFICPGYFTVPKTEFKICDFKNATAMYMGTNWDGLRHKDLFHLLIDGAYLNCYGPKLSWSQYPASLYKGEIPFDGVSALSAYYRHGIGLSIGMPECDDENVANNRLFEVPAASALPICARNELNYSMYGDAALYVNKNVPTPELAEQIIVNVNWVRENHVKAQEMARAVHTSYCNNFSMEYYLQEILAMHARAVVEEQRVLESVSFANAKSYGDSGVESNTKILYLTVIQTIDEKLENLLNDLIKQTSQNFEVIILAMSIAFKKRLLSKYGKKLNLTYFSYQGEESNEALLALLKTKGAKWLSILNSQHKLFSNHSAALMDAYSNGNQNPIGVFSASLECSDVVALPELMKDPHNIYNRNKIRVGHVDFDVNLPLNSLVINLQQIDAAFFNTIDFYRIDAKTMITQLLAKGSILQVCEVTCATYVDDNKEMATSLQQLREQLDATTAQLYHMGNVFKQLSEEFIVLKQQTLEKMPKPFLSRVLAYFSNRLQPGQIVKARGRG